MLPRKTILAVGLWCIATFPPALRAAELTPETIATLANQIKPQPGEARWLEIPWLLDLHEARRQAAAEGKPLFVYSGGGATGIGAC